LTLRLLLLGLVLLVATPGHARGTLYATVGNGVSAPVAGKEWKHRFAPSYKFSLRAGIEWQPHKRVLLGPELTVEAIPLHPRDSIYADNGLDARYTRTRATIGGRLGLVFPHGAFFFRAGLGLDYVGGWTRTRGLPRVKYDSMSVAVTPGLGIALFPIKYLEVGAFFGPTIAIYDFNDGAGEFVAVDFDAVLTIGGRL